MQLSLKGKVAAVTGGSEGIGRATALRLAELGAKVAICARRAEVLEKTAGEIRKLGAEVLAVTADATKADAMARFVEQVVQRFGRIDILVNNAGITRDNPLAAFDDDDVAAVLATNVTGVFNVTRAVVPYMTSQRSGVIVNLSSVAGDKGGRGQTNYAASKGAINAFTRALAVELAPRKVRVNCVAPGVIETEMSAEVRELAGDAVLSRILLRRYGQASEVADAVWFLASAHASYVTGQVLTIDGGFKME
jgi:3-oxoacyl-[acyl-carrier protein] reductase